MDTLLLDRTTWDLCKDAAGNIAVASRTYSIAQDVSSAVRLFIGELWYDTAKGIPYWQDVLGKQTSLSALKALIAKAAMTVPEVASVKVFISSVADRSVVGQIQITDTRGLVTTTTFGG